MKTIVYLVNNASYFVSHRIDLALEAKKRKWKVLILYGKSSAQNEQNSINKIKKLGISCRKVNFNKGSINPVNEFVGLMHLIFLLRRIKPDILHTVSPKGNLYGGIAAKILRVNSLVIAITGKGYIFTNTKQSIAKTFLSILYKIAQNFSFRHKNIFFIVQNKDDFRTLEKKNKINKDRIICLPGSGVDLNKYTPDNNIKRKRLVILPARILEDKGVLDFIEAAKIVKKYDSNIKMVLVGEIDRENPAHIAESKISFWVNKGIIEWWKYRTNMPEIYRIASIVCLPSYREGLPKVLIEAAACGCPVITTNVIGCREAIIPGLTGDLVREKSPKLLAKSILSLIDDKNRMNKYSHEGRLFAKKKFGIESIVVNTFKVYEYILNKKQL